MLMCHVVMYQCVVALRQHHHTLKCHDGKKKNHTVDTLFLWCSTTPFYKEVALQLLKVEYHWFRLLKKNKQKTPPKKLKKNPSPN